MLVNGAVHASNLVLNGGFQLTTNGPGQMGQQGVTNALGWTVNNPQGTYAYNFIFAPGTLDKDGSPTSQFGGTLLLWGTQDGGTTVVPASSPDGGNFLVADGAYETYSISQVVTGLTPGTKYVLGFYWAAGQQLDFTRDTTENWTVSFGNQSFTTPTVTNPSHGFTNWMFQTFTFTASSTSQTLSFLAAGTPDSTGPPFSLLDGVSLTRLTPVPEPSSIAFLLTGAAGVASLLRKRAR